MSENRARVTAKIIKAHDGPVEKAEQPTALEVGRNDGTSWLRPTLDQKGLKVMVDHSTILPQCIRSYKDNIPGFGIGLRYKEDTEETLEMKAEWDMVDRTIDLLNLDMSTKEVFEDVIEARETYGISYLEVMRGLEGEVNQVEFIRDVPTIRKTVPLEPAVNVEYFYKGELIPRRKKFRKYKQEKDGKTVFFREYGDPRMMDWRTGVYGEAVDLAYQANEIIEFAIGTEDYGAPRWIGQALSVDGSRRAENLNNNYFKNGRHTPLAIVISGGTLSDESEAKLQEYVAGIKGEDGQHAFLLLQVEGNENTTGFEQEKKPVVELKDMAAILQKDELFQAYLDNSRRKVQSAFRLPDLYVGYTTDFNRATAQTAQEITEKQVFQPERESLAWVINNKLLNGYQLKYVETYFKAPDITNPDDLFKMLTVTEKAGGVTPDMAKQIAYKTMGLDGEEDYPEEWGKTPLAVLAAQKTAAAPAGDISGQLDAAIKKAAEARDDDVVAVMLDVRRLLKQRMKVVDS